MNYTEEISNKLNDLLVKNYDAEKGYKNAIHHIEDDRLKLLFNRRIEERHEFANELKTEIVKFNETPENTGSFKGAMHRDWTSLKATFNGNKEQAVLDEVIKGEKASLEEYSQVLEETHLPPTTDSLLMKHKKAIEASINTEKSYTKIVS